MSIFPVIATYYHGLDARVKDGYFGRVERNHVTLTPGVDAR
jgi:hypothetical protein